MLASIAMLSITSCDTLSQNGDVVVAEDVRFILKEDAIDLTTANIRVRHTGSSDVMWVFMQTQDLDTPADELIEERVKNEYAYTNSIIARTGSNISLPFSGLEVKNYYRIIVKAINRDGNLYGEAASLIFKTKRNPNSWEVNENWNLEYVSRTPGYRDGADVDLENFQCTSSDSESYILLSLSKEDWERIADAMLELGQQFAIMLRRKNFEGQGEQDARELEADIICAVSAIKYVAEFAADKCVFAAPKEG